MANDELITRLGEISIQVFTIGKLYGLKDLEKLSMQMNELADDIGSNWHTGTPKEEGWYVWKGHNEDGLFVEAEWKPKGRTFCHPNEVEEWMFVGN